MLLLRRVAGWQAACACKVHMAKSSTETTTVKDTQETCNTHRTSLYHLRQTLAAFAIGKDSCCCAHGAAAAADGVVQ